MLNTQFSGIHWVSISIVKNNKAVGYLFCNPQKSFYTSSGHSNSNNGSCLSIILQIQQWNLQKMLRLSVIFSFFFFFFFVNAIVEFEELLTASIFRVGISRRGVKTLLLITE